jgi:hypothetical protein
LRPPEDCEAWPRFDEDPGPSALSRSQLIDVH